MEEGGQSTAVDTRARILDAAIALLDRGGRDAVTTRAVGVAAGVQAPTIYRLFGDKNALLDAAVMAGFMRFRDQQDRTPGDDPVDDLRRGWNFHVRFGLTHPHLYALMYGDPRVGRLSPAASAAADVAAGHLRRIAEGGRLRVTEKQALDLVHATGSGITLTLIAQPAERRDLGLSDLAREAIIAAVTTDGPAVAGAGPAAAAVHLRAALDHSSALSPNERGLLGDWLERIASTTDAAAE